MTELYRELISKVPNFKGLKADLSVAVQLDDLLLPDHKIFIANHFLTPSAVLGYDSSIATVNNLFPRLVRELVESATKNAPKIAMSKQTKLNALVAAITHEGKYDFGPSMKYAMGVVTGINMGPPRRPLQKLDSKQMDQIKLSLDKINK
ncbi:hypothetical protein ACJJTC_015271 [Scirpophaga incertulas]